MQTIPHSIKHIHLIAICGTGMGSLAGLLQDRGYEVTGSDTNIYPPMSDELKRRNIKVFEGYKAQNLKTKPDLIVVGNAVSKDNPEVLEMQHLNIPYISMPEALSHFFITGKKSVVVTGTHGKTTTTALLSHLFTEFKVDPSYMIGGVLQAGLPSLHDGKGDYFVIEGDEYDTSFFDKGPKFLHYQPYYTLITSLEFDHADIYKDIDHLRASFEKLLSIVNPKGFVLACSEYKELTKILNLSPAAVETYGIHHNADWMAKNIQFDFLKTTFDVIYKNQKLLQLTSPLAGEHNVLNTLAAFALSHHLKFDAQDFQKALLKFKGIKRRQEVRLDKNGIVIIDDFAHHPTAVRQTILAIKKRYPKHKLWAVFEPRSNSSKRDIFQKDYAVSFDDADEVVLSDVFMPEKIKDGKILDIAKLAADIKKVPACHISGTDKIVSLLKTKVISPSVILVMSNGGFDGIHDKLIRCFGV